MEEVEKLSDYKNYFEAEDYTYVDLDASLIYDAYTNADEE